MLKLIQVTRALELSLREDLVERGLAVDPVPFLNNEAAYLAARQSIVDQHGYYVRIFGAGRSEDRGEVEAPSLYVDLVDIPNSGRSSPRKVTLSPVDEQNLQSGYRQTPSPESTTNLIHEVRLIAETIAQERLLIDVVRSSLGISKRKYLYGAQEDGSRTAEGFWQVGGNLTRVSTVPQQEWVIRYTAQEVWLADEKETSLPDLPAITDPRLDTEALCQRPADDGTPPQ